MINRTHKNILFCMLCLLFFIGANAQNSIDEFEYHYPDGSNRLTHIDDAVSSSTITSDIEDQADNNYEYNAIGQLTHDEAEGIESIEWEVGGKVSSVLKTDGSTLSFTYDAAGNRIIKTYRSSIGDEIITYYLRDAKGNLIARYEQENSGVINLKEFPMHGATQLGIISTSIDHSSSLSNDSTYTRELGSKSYELKDYLGNVRTVITDIKNSTLDASNNPGNFSADIASTADYYSYGMQMLGRTYQSSNYKYGFQGKEKDDELKGDGNSYDFGARLLDPRVGRWLSTDPLEDNYPSTSTYSAMANNPIMCLDPDGRKVVVVGSQKYKEQYALARERIIAAGGDAAEIMAVLEGSSRKITVREIHDQNDRTNGTTVWWDPTSSLRVATPAGVATGGKQDAAAGLIHEFSHSWDFIFDNATFTAPSYVAGNPNLPYSNPTDRKAIRGPERTYVDFYGQSRRYTHLSAGVYHARSPISTETGSETFEEKVARHQAYIRYFILGEGAPNVEKPVAETFINPGPESQSNSSRFIEETNRQEIKYREMYPAEGAAKRADELYERTWTKRIEDAQNEE